MGEVGADRAIVSIQMPIVLAHDTEPEPDVQVLRRRAVPSRCTEHRTPTAIARSA
jgi:hypothetical protein